MGIARTPRLQFASSTARRLFAGASWSVGSLAINALGNLVTNAALARLLEPADLGQYFLAFGMTLVLANTALLGTNLAALRFVSEALARGDSGAMRRSFIVGMSLGLLSVLVICSLFASLFGPPLLGVLVPDTQLSTIAPAVGLWIAVTAARQFSADLFRGLLAFGSSALFDGTITAILTSGVFGFLWLRGIAIGLDTAILISAAAGLVSALLAFAVLGRRFLPLPQGGAKPGWGLFIRTSLPMAISTPVLRGDQWFFLWSFALVGSAETVALLGADLRLLLLLAIPYVIAGRVVQPFLSQLSGAGRDAELISLVRSLTGLIAWVNLPMTLAICLLAVPILQIVYGPFYTAAAWALVIIVIARYVAESVGPSQHVLNMTGHERDVLAVIIPLTPIAVLAVIPVGTWWGLTGVAVVIGAFFLVRAILLGYCVRRRTGYWLVADLRPSAVLRTFFQVQRRHTS